jgi:hypothetical protein
LLALRGGKMQQATALPSDGAPEEAIPRPLTPRYDPGVLRSIALAPCLGVWLAAPAAAREPAPVDFGREVRPILESSCWKCHGEAKQRGGLRLDRRDTALAGGDSGKSAVSPGSIERSELIRRVEAADPAERMPQGGEPLRHEQIETLRTWIAEGAPWPEAAAASAGAKRELVVTDEDRRHWSYRPLRPVEPPAARDASWCRTPVDRFIQAALEARDLRPNPDADRRTLIRRLSFDLLGLPPEPEEVEAFLADTQPAAYEELVDRLLASPRFGERWGRHWLDVARYADSDGLETDADRPDAYPYRDFVIRARNEDLPWTTFVRWQLAGDEYAPDNPEALAATGFLTGAPTEFLMVPMEEEKLRLRFNELDDMAATTVSAFLGLTLGCARCHDHKFDAIPTRDYYRLQCAFTTTAREHHILAPRPEAAAHRAAEKAWQERVKSAQAQLDGWLAEQKKLAKEEGKASARSDEDLRRALTAELRQRWDELKEELDRVRRTQPVGPPTALGIADRSAEPAPTHLLERGDFYARKELLQVGFLSVLTGSRPPEDYWASARREAQAAGSTGQRRALAEWITDLEQGAGPLLARVIVNRLWQHHFGEGLTRTAGDFGVRGEAPSHPELLEWLAGELVAGGWRLKPLHRLLVTSAVYRQSIAFDTARAESDPDNRLLWRRRPRRLEAEVLRDTVLAASGTLNFQAFGPAFKPPIPREAMLARNTKNPYPADARDTPDTRRRTVYMFHKRVVQHPLLQAFDGPDAAVSCSRRSQTTVAPQALALLNDPFLRDRAADFAGRLLDEGGPGPDGWVDRAYRLALSRPPRDAERDASVRFIEEQGQRRMARDPKLTPGTARLQAITDFCQTLFSLNELIHVD